MIEQLQMRIKEIESFLEQSAANHNGLIGRLNEAKHLLDMATKAADVVAPESEVTKVIDAVDHLVDALVSPSE